MENSPALPTGRITGRGVGRFIDSLPFDALSNPFDDAGERQRALAALLDGLEQLLEDAGRLRPGEKADDVVKALSAFASRPAAGFPAAQAAIGRVQRAIFLLLRRHGPVLRHYTAGRTAPLSAGVAPGIWTLAFFMLLALIARRLSVPLPLSVIWPRDLRADALAIHRPLPEPPPIPAYEEDWDDTPLNAPGV